MLIFFVIGVTVICTMYLYSGMRLIHPLHISKNLRIALWGILLFSLLLCFSPFILWIENPEGPFIDALFRIVFFEFGLFTILFPLIFARDAVFTSARLAGKALKFFIKKSGNNYFHKLVEHPLLLRFLKFQKFIFIMFHPPFRRTERVKAVHKIDAAGPEKLSGEDTLSTVLNRRDFLINTGNAAIFGIAFSMTGYGLLRSQELPEVERITIPIKDLPASFNGFRIAQISDLHVGPYIKREYVERTVALVNSLSADMIAVTGDMVDGSVHYLWRDIESLADLNAPSGKFFVTGNHEYYSGVEQWIDAFRNMDIRPLLNENSTLLRGKEKIVIAGVTDFREGTMVKGHKTNPLAAAKNAPDGTVKILLAHQPQSIYAASKLGFDFQMSGHTHGGQYFPYTYLIDLFQPYVSGLHRHEGTYIYVNRGTGYWGPPQRTGKSGEITLFELRRENA